MTQRTPFKFTLKFYLTAALVEGILSLAGLLLIPSDPKNAWLLGLSKSRLLMLGAAVILLGLFGLLVSHLLRNHDRRRVIERRIDRFTSQSGNLTTAVVLTLAGFVGGSLFLRNTFTTTDLFLKGYYIRLAPWMAWFTVLCAQTLSFLILRDWKTFKAYLSRHGRALSLVLVILTVGLLAHAHLWDIQPEAWDVNKLFNYDDKFDIFRQDIYAVFREGTNLLAGINPYSRVHQLGDDLTWNFEIPTYFPIFYCLNWFTQKIGFQDFFYWLDLWRVVFLIANLGVAYLIFFIPYHRFNQPGFAALGALFWLFNRWTLHITMIYHIDFMAIFFMVLSLVLWPRYRVISLLSFGVSLGIKQIAIFLIPLYLIWIWGSLENRSWTKFGLYVLALFAVPIMFIGPFLYLDAGGFIKSVLLSATRNAESHFGIPSIDALLVLSGIPAKIPMLGLMALTYVLAWKGKIDHFVAAFLTMVIFVDFNSVLFRQYMTWVAALIPLALTGALITPASAEGKGSPGNAGV